MGAYKSLIKLTVLDKIEKDAILERDDEVHTFRCANKMTNETMGSIKLRFTISDEIYEHWFLIFKEQFCPVILGLDFLNRMCIRWDDQERLEVITQQKWLALNEVSVDRVNVNNSEYPLGILKAIRNTVIPAGLYTSCECGLVFEDGSSAGTYHMDVTGEFLNKGIECKIKTREFQMYPCSPTTATDIMVNFDSKAFVQSQIGLHQCCMCSNPPGASQPRSCP